MAASYFDYENQMSDLNRKQGDEDAVSKYGRFVSQQRFNRSKLDMSQGFERKTPQFNANFAQRGLGNSGIFRQQNANRVNDYAANYNDLVANEAATMGQADALDTSRQASYREALLRLMEQLQTARAAENQFAGF